MARGPYRRECGGRLRDGMDGGDGVWDERRNPADYVRKQCRRDECGGGCYRADLGGRG